MQTYQNTVGANVVEAEAHVRVDTAGAPVPLGTAVSPVRTDPTGTTTQPVSDAGGSITVDAPLGTPVRVDPTGTTTQPVSGTVTANAGTGVFDVTPAAPVATDYLPARVTDGTAFVAPLAEGTFTGRINTQGQKTMAASTPVVVASDQSNVPVSQATASSLNAEVQGDAAHDAPVSGNPILMAGRANLNEPAAVADGDATSVWADQLGRQVVIVGHSNPEAPVPVNGSAAGVTVIATPGVGLSLYIMKGSMHNRAATETVVSLREGAAGAIRFTANLAPDGGGTLFDFGSRGWKLPANTALVADIGQASVDVNITEYYIAA